MHNHQHNDLYTERNLKIAFALNLAITIAQTITAITSGSLALLADAMHNFSDVMALGISYIARLLSHKVSTNKQTFGFKRAEILAAMVNSMTLLFVAGYICKEASIRLYTPQTIETDDVIYLAALGIFVNFASAWILREGAKHNLNIRSSYLHLLSDAAGSVAVLLSATLIYFFGIYWIDSLISILLAFYLVYTSTHILMQTTKVLMQFPPEHIDIENIKNEIIIFGKIKGVHHIHLWQLNEKDIHLEAHLDFTEDIRLSEAGAKINAIKARLAEKFAITHFVFQAESKQSALTNISDCKGC